MSGCHPPTCYCNDCYSGEVAGRLCKHRHPIRESDCLLCLEEGRKLINEMNKSKEEKLMLCTCKCHVSQIHHCQDCCGNILGRLPDHNYKGQESILIKKALWDEMLEYKKKVDALIHEVFSTQLNRIEDHEERIKETDQVQVNFIRSVNGRIEELNRHKNYQINENRKVSRTLGALENIIEYIKGHLVI